MEIIKTFFNNLFLLASAMSFFILIGLIIAGVLKQIIPDNFVSKHLGKSSFGSVIKAAIFGAPLPVCSCSVIPFAKSLHKEGASKGAVESFLISAPITGVDSILATYSVFGWFFTIYRVVTSLIIAISVGVLENIFGVKEKKPTIAKFSLNVAQKPTLNVNFTKESSCCSGGSCCGSSKEKSFSIKGVFNYAFNTLFSDIAKSILIGLVLGAIFTTFIPKEVLTTLFENRWLSYIGVILVAIPLYVCATSSLPIAAAFLLGGMTPGAAFIFLSAGPATSTVTMGVVASMFGKRSLFIYVGVIAILSIIFGALLDNLLPNLNIVNIANSIENITTLDIISTIIFFLLTIYYILKG